jgi:hypothetical protein
MAVLMHEMLTNCQDDDHSLARQSANVMAWFGRALRVWQSRG